MKLQRLFDRLYKAGKVRNFGVSNMTPMMMEMLSREIQFPICANQIQLSCAVTQVFDAGFHMDMQCDKWNHARWRWSTGMLPYEKIPVQAWSSLQYGYFQGTFLGSDNYRELNTVLNRTLLKKVVTLWLLLLPGFFAILEQLRL